MRNIKGSHRRRFFLRRDICLLAVLLVAALAVWLTARQLGAGLPAHRADVVYRGAVILSIDLRESGRFSIAELPQVELEVRDGAAAFVRSNCPDQVCVNTGWLRISGDFAACLPNEVLLVIPVEDGGVDAVAR